MVVHQRSHRRMSRCQRVSGWVMAIASEPCLVASIMDRSRSYSVMKRTCESVWIAPESVNKKRGNARAVRTGEKSRRKNKYPKHKAIRKRVKNAGAWGERTVNGGYKLLAESWPDGKVCRQREEEGARPPPVRLLGLNTWHFSDQRVPTSLISPSSSDPSRPLLTCLAHAARPLHLARLAWATSVPLVLWQCSTVALACSID